MEIVMGLLPTVISAVLSLVGVVVSALIAKKTARITAEAEIQKLKMELEHTDKVRGEDLSRAKERELCDARQGMLAAISDYGEKPDRNTKVQRWRPLQSCGRLLKMMIKNLSGR